MSSSIQDAHPGGSNHTSAPKTPEKTKGQEGGTLEATPISDGLSSLTASRGGETPTQKGIEDNAKLHEDLQDTPVVSYRNMLIRFLLRLNSGFYPSHEEGWESATSATVKKATKQLDTLLERAGNIVNCKEGSHGSDILRNLQAIADTNNEKSVYTPFISASNYALADLIHVDLDDLAVRPTELLLHKNDYGLGTTRESVKPDVIGFSSEVYSRLYPASTWTQIAIGTPPEPALCHKKEDKIHVPSCECDFAFEIKRTAAGIPSPKNHYETRSLAQVQEHAPLKLTKLGMKPKAGQGTTSLGTQSTQSTQVSSLQSESNSNDPNTTSTERKRKAPATSSQRNTKRRLGPETLASDALVRSARYAADRMSSAVWISHAINFVVKDDYLYIGYFDRQSPLRTTGLNYIQDLPCYLVLLWILQRLPPEQKGIISELKPPYVHAQVPAAKEGEKPEDTTNRYFQRETKIDAPFERKPPPLARRRQQDRSQTDGESNSKKSNLETSQVGKPANENTAASSSSGDQRPVPLSLDLAASLMYSYTLKGRATRVYPTVDASDDPSGDKSVDAGAGESKGAGAGAGMRQTPVKGNKKQRAKKSDAAGAEGKKPVLKAPQYVAKISWPEIARENEVQIISEATEEGKRNVHIKNHIPVIHSWCQYQYFDTSHIREDLNDIQTNANLPLGVKDTVPVIEIRGARILRVLVLEGLVPITSLPAEDMYRCLWECYFCHYYLWEAGIHHGDISHKNLMAKMVDGQWRGVLNDYDLAILVLLGQKRIVGFERTGTLPFMAMDLLMDLQLGHNKPRLYRYDAESFAWVSLWISTRYEGGKEIRNPPLQHWTSAPLDQLAQFKQGLQPNDCCPTETYKDCWTAVWAQISFWQDRRTASSRNAFFKSQSTDEPEPAETASRFIESVQQLVSQDALHPAISVPDIPPFKKPEPIPALNPTSNTAS